MTIHNDTGTRRPSDWTKKPPLWATIGVSLLALALVGYLDYATGKLSILLFYFLPIGIAAWYGGRWPGLILSFLALGVWFRASYWLYEYSGLASAAWETGIAGGMFITFALLLSSLRNARARAQAAMEQLARSNQELQEFAYVASHDLQEPIRVITLFLELLQRQYGEKLDAHANEFIGHATDSAERMMQMIRDLLAYSRVESDTTLQDVNCGEVMCQVLENLQPAIAESGAMVQVDALPTVKGSPTLLMRLFQNLLSNAIKFRGPRTPVVHMAARQAGGQWGFSVQDNGIGLDHRQADRAFIMFERIHDRSKYPGTGIGLATCKRIVERHGGRIWVESTPGEGSTFYFTISKR
jgi:light-regulated signal transduction histidine kinase (bacteriophytochrome)